MRAVAGFLAVLAFASACTGDGGEPQPQAAERLVVGTTELPGSLDPAECYEAFCAYALFPNTHEGLVRFPPDGVQPEPAVAESWQVSPDGLRYTFTLREDVRLHDGTPVTASVVKRSLERVDRIGGDPAFILFDVRNDPPIRGITAVETPDERTVTIVLARPDSAFLAALAYPAAAVVSPDAPPDGPAEQAPAGAGPYRIAGVTADGSIDLEAFRGYHGEAPAERRVRLRPFSSPGALQEALREGEAHLAVRSWEPGELDGLSGLEVSARPGPATRFLAFNTTRPPFDRVEIRRAVAAALDREALLRASLEGTAEPLTSLVPGGFPSHVDAFGGLEAPGVDAPPAVELWYTPSHYGPAEEALAEAVAAGLREGGFEVSVRTAEWADFKGSIARGEYGMYLLGWFPDVLHPADYLRPFLGSEESRAVGANYASEEVDALLDELRTTTDEGRSRQILADLQRRVAADVPYVPLAQLRRHAVHTDAVTGVSAGISHLLWLPPVRLR